MRLLIFSLITLSIAQSANAGPYLFCGIDYYDQLQIQTTVTTPDFTIKETHLLPVNSVTETCGGGYRNSFMDFRVNGSDVGKAVIWRMSLVAIWEF